MRARYYDPETGSFLSSDSYSGNLTDPLSQNRYTYAQNNPVNYIDPSGHSILDRAVNFAKNIVSTARDYVVGGANILLNGARNVYHSARNTMINTYNKIRSYTGNLSQGRGMSVRGAHYRGISYGRKYGRSLSDGWQSAGYSSGGYYTSQPLSAYERAVKSGASSYNWMSSKSKEAENIRRSWTKSLENTIVKFCTTASKTEKQTVADPVKMKKNSISSINTLGDVPKWYVYDRDAAIDYAKKYSNSMEGMDTTLEAVLGKFGIGRNPKYYSYGTNCANFTSQCLYESGIPMDEEWYSERKIIFEPASSVLGSRTHTENNVGEPWRLAQKQFEYFSNPDNGFSDGNALKITTPEELQNATKNYTIEKGDLLYFMNDEGEIEHAAIISKVEYGVISYSANTKRRFDTNLTESLGGGEGVYILHLNDVIRR